GSPSETSRRSSRSCPGATGVPALLPTASFVSYTPKPARSDPRAGFCVSGARSEAPLLVHLGIDQIERLFACSVWPIKNSAQRWCLRSLRMSVSEANTVLLSVEKNDCNSCLLARDF